MLFHQTGRTRGAFYAFRDLIRSTPAKLLRDAWVLPGETDQSLISLPPCDEP